MKKLFSILSLFLITASAVSQEPAKAKARPKLTEADLLLCDKNWQIVSVEEWGVVTRPAPAKNSKDMLFLKQDGTYHLMLFGNKKHGTWTKSGQYIYFTDEATKKKFNYKVLLAEENKLKVDHYTDEEGHSIFEYEVK